MEIKDRVLIVEDDKNIRKFIQTILEANDYDVIATETGKEAYSLITSRCPDVVILDLGRNEDFKRSPCVVQYADYCSFCQRS